MNLETNIKEQIKKLAIVQYLIWQKELPEGFSWEAIEISLCYSLLGISFSQKISPFTRAVLSAMIAHLAKQYALPEKIEELKAMEQSFRLEVDGHRYPVSDCTAVNDLLAKAGLKLRLLSGYYGSCKFYLLGQAAERRIGKYTVYRVKEEAAVTPGCHLLMAALVGGENVFLREASARFLYYHKWRGALDGREDLASRIRRAALEKFGIQQEADFKPNAAKFITAFSDNLLYHEVNHDSIEHYIKDREVLGLAEASKVLGENILTHLIEVIADWLPGKSHRSPLLKICEGKELASLTLYVSDNWFYGTGFPEQESFSALDLAPLFRHWRAGEFDWQGLLLEMGDMRNGSLLSLYLKHFEETARRVRAIIRESEFILVDRPVSYFTIAAHLEGKLRDKNQTTFWSNVFVYLRKYSPEGYQRVRQCLVEAEEQLKLEVCGKIGCPDRTLDDAVRAKAEEVFGCA